MTSKDIDEVSERTRRISRKLLISPIVLLALLAQVIQINHRFIWSRIKPTWNFKATENGAHVLYEPGTRALAEEITKSLPDSVAAKIEHEQFQPFKTPVIIYVCGTPQSFDEFTTLKGAMATTVSPAKIFINPMLANKEHRERIGYIIHELSHAHLQQYTGLFAFRLSPNWFKEGLAVLVSDGSGAGMVNDDEAIEFIVPDVVLSQQKTAPMSRKSNPHLLRSGTIP